MRQRFWVVVLVLSIFTLSQCTTTSFRLASAQTATLAETLNLVINNVNWTYGNSWTSNWAMILASRGEDVFDEAITADVDRGDFVDALYVARLAELEGYQSETIINATQTALQQIVMCGGLPITANAHGYGDPDLNNTGCYLVYDRFALWGYKYAEEVGLADKWNVTQAFRDFAKAYDGQPAGSVSGEMLWCDPQENWAKSYTSRYYDEHAETLSVFLKFAELGVQNASSYADSAWNGVQAHWNAQEGYYGYTGTTLVECEMGNFAQIISEYKDLKEGTIQYWDRVIQDLNYKLLAKGWSSPGWAPTIPGVIRHAQTNPQLRLGETMGALIALQGLFPDFTPAMKSTWTDMLMNGSAWQGLMGSSLNTDGCFRVVSDGHPSNAATACAAATLFLYGIVPVTGNLAILSREEFYNDLRTPFVPSDFMFDYENHKIRIPLNAGEMTFVYGSIPVSYNFTSDGVYEIEFTSDWNQIESINGQVALKPAKPQKLIAAEGNASIALSWSPPLSDGGSEITNYRVYRGNASGTEVFLKEIKNVLYCIDTEVTQGGTYYYQITAINSIGESEFSNETNTTLSDPITIDDYDGLWHTSDFLIHLNASDPSGVHETYYKLNGGPVVNVSVDGQPKITLQGGNVTLEYWSVDNAGNEELPHAMLAQVKLDKELPTGSVQITNGASSTASTSVELTLTANDITSGVYEVRFSNDGVWDSEPWETPTSTKTWTLTLGDGTKTVYYQIRDNAGLLSNTYSDTIILQSPTPSLSPSPKPTPSPSPSLSPSPRPTLTPTPPPSRQPTASPTPQPEEQPLFLYTIVALAALASVGAAIFILKKWR